MSYTIVTDSSCNLPEALIERYGIEVLPLRFMSEGKEYVSFLKGKVTDLAAFYTMMRDGKVFTTSLPNQQLSTDIIRTEFERGNDILYIGFSSKLSGTYEATAALLDEIGPPTPTAATQPSTRAGHRSAKGCSYSTRPASASWAIRSTRWPHGLTTRASAWPTGSPSTTSCTSTGAGA